MNTDMSPLADWILRLMTDEKQGWHIHYDNDVVRPPLSELDGAIYHTLRMIAINKEKLAVGLPRVVTGTTIGPLIYVSLNLLVQLHSNRASQLRDFVRFPQSRRMGQFILASRSHAIREMWAKSTLSFSGVETRLSSFRTYRLSRTGDLKKDIYSLIEAGKRPSEGDLIKGLPDIALYDFWPLPKRPGRVRAIFAELSAADSKTTTQRLLDLVNDTNPEWALVLLNLHDIENRKRLNEAGFRFVALSCAVPEEKLEDERLYPSFTAIAAATPQQVNVVWSPLSHSDACSQALADAFKEIVEADSQIPDGHPYPYIMNRAWYLLNQLSECPVPLTRYEKLRRADPREKTLGFWVKKLDNVNWHAIPEAVRAPLVLRWRSIAERLKSAYKCLLDDNPLSWHLAETIIDANDKIVLLMPSQLAAQALREEMLLEYRWKESESRAAVMSVRDAHRADVRPKKVVWLGTWGNRHRPLLWGLLANTVEIVGYPYQALVLVKRLEEVRHDLSESLPTTTKETLGPPIPSNLTISWNSDTIQRSREQTLGHWHQRQDENAVDSDELREPLYEGNSSFAMYERVAHRMSAQQDTSAFVDDEDDEVVTAVRVRFVDGTSLVSRVDHEYMVLPRGKSDAEQKIATELRPKDRVLVLSQSEHEDVFAVVLARTNHLLDIDQRVIDYWRQALWRLRQKYPTSKWGMGARFCEDLERLGCERDRVTMRSWLKGSAMAPRSRDDISYLLQLSGNRADSATWSRLIEREIKQVRDFHRRIGRRIVKRMQTHGEIQPSNAIDAEIDELLEEADLRVVSAVSEPFDTPKHTVVTMVEEAE